MSKKVGDIILPVFKKELNTEIGGYIVADRSIFKTRSAKLPAMLHKIPNGDYDVIIRVKPTTGFFDTRKPLISKGKVEIISGQVFIGDPSAVHTISMWDRFLTENRLFRHPMKHAIYIDVGGDGKGIVSVELKKVK